MPRSLYVPAEKRVSLRWTHLELYAHTKKKGLELSAIMHMRKAALICFATLATQIYLPDVSYARESARIFLSGHSLMDDPLASDIQSIATSLGTSMRYNQQISIGSPIRVRTTGNGGWAGYRSGKNRRGSNLDVIDELRHPKTLAGDRYDTLLITERHDLIGPLIWEDTIKYLRHFHERLVDGNPQGNTVFFESWQSIKDKNNPGEWIAYERAASPVWRCTVSRINASLELEHRQDRLRSLPAGLALAYLVEKAIASPGLPGITKKDASQTLEVLFKDDVHLTRLGVYYIALVSYAAIFDKQPIGAWKPDRVDAAQAAAAQKVASEFMQVIEHQDQDDKSVEDCQSYMQSSFCETNWTYLNRQDQIEGCRRLFMMKDFKNPFYFNPETDNTYWLSKQ